MITPRRKTSSVLLSAAAISALSLSACGGDGLGNDDQDDDDAQPTATVTETVEAEATEDAIEEATDSPADDTATEDPEPTGDPTESPQADGDEGVYQAVDAVMEEYPDAVVLDFDTEPSYYEFTILNDGSEWDLEVDMESYEISNTREDSVDSDDQRKAETVEIEFTEALRTAAEEGGGTPEQAELDEDNGTVVWEIELDNGQEIYVDVATGDVASSDNNNNDDDDDD